MITNQTFQTLRMLGQRCVGRTRSSSTGTTSIFLRGANNNIQTSSYHKDKAFVNNKHPRRHYRTISSKASKDIIKSALQKPAGPLYKHDIHDIIVKDNNTDSNNSNDHDHASTTLIEPGHSDFFIPEVSLHENDGRKKHRVLV